MTEILGGISPFALGYAIACVFLAAIVRGFSGFGFSLLTITSLSLVLPTSIVVPAIFMLEIAASIHMLPGVWRQVHWRSLAPLLAGCLVATPFGVWLLGNAPQAPMKVALGLFVLACVALLAKGYALRTMPGLFSSTAAGAAAGLANGAFGIGGPPVILFYFASPAGAAAGRASLIAFFMATDVIGLGFLSREGLIGWDNVKMAALFLPALLAGVWVGQRGFRNINEARFRQFVLALLALLACITLFQGWRALS